MLAMAGAESLAEVYMTRDEALLFVFGDARVERKAVFLTDEQLERVRDLSRGGIEIKSALVTQYVATSNDGLLGTAYFDTHPVRTLQETIMVVVTPEGTVDRVEILSFLEPREYLPRDAWLKQFEGRALDGDLTLEKSIHGITGATLSARAVTDAMRRVLAVHGALSEARP
jgi:hypothetical protein